MEKPAGDTGRRVTHYDGLKMSRLKPIEFLQQKRSIGSRSRSQVARKKDWMALRVYTF